MAPSVARMRMHCGRFAGGAVLALALGAALTLAGCGRKGGLDAPPMAANGDLQTPTQAAPPQPPPPANTATQPPEKRKTFLDWLIN